MPQAGSSPSPALEGAAQPKPESLSHAQAGVDPGEAQLGTWSDTGQCQTESRQDLAGGLLGMAWQRQRARVSSGGGCAGQAAPGEDHLLAWGEGVFLLSLQSSSLSQGSSASPTRP